MRFTPLPLSLSPVAFLNGKASNNFVASSEFLLSVYKHEVIINHGFVSNKE